jgi:L-amino acid N-acyltransferase YncA
VTTRRVAFDETYRDLSYEWLHDEDLRRLTMAPVFDREAQERWYASLPGRDDYLVWGIEHDGEPAGVMGLKDAGEADGMEYYMYLGRRDLWGRGIAKWALAEIAEEARGRGHARLYGRISKANERSMGVHTGYGFYVVREDPDSWWVAYDLA